MKYVFGAIMAIIYGAMAYAFLALKYGFSSYVFFVIMTIIFIALIIYFFVPRPSIPAIPDRLVILGTVLDPLRLQSLPDPIVQGSLMIVWAILGAAVLHIFFTSLAFHEKGTIVAAAVIALIIHYSGLSPFVHARLVVLGTALDPLRLQSLQDPIEQGSLMIAWAILGAAVLHVLFSPLVKK